MELQKSLAGKALHQAPRERISKGVLNRASGSASKFQSHHSQGPLIVDDKQPGTNIHLELSPDGQTE
jgi:hypothetical protein